MGTPWKWLVVVALPVACEQRTELGLVSSPAPSAALSATMFSPWEPLAGSLPVVSGRCKTMVIIPAPTDAERAAFSIAFHQRNPRAPRAGAERGLMGNGHYLATAEEIEPSPSPGATRSPDSPSVDDPAVAEHRALDVISRNADLLGFTLAELKEAKVDISRGFPNTNIAFRTVATISVPRPGYEAFPSVAKESRIAITTLYDGAMSLTRSGTVLPPFELCRTPPLEPDSPQLLRGLLGIELSKGQTRSPSGDVIKESDIGKKEVELTQKTDFDGAVGLRLIYSISLRDGWGSASVDAGTGELLAAGSFARQ